MVELPMPPVPADASLRHYRDMPLEVGRLRDSGIFKVRNAEVFRSALALWCVAWHQIPAGSLPDDDDELVHMAGLGRDLKAWRKIKAGALRGWCRFSDGRLYHPVVSEKVVGALNSTLAHEWNKACARIRKENSKRARDKQAEKLPPPPKPEPITLAWPADLSRVPEREPGAPVRAPDGEFRSEGKGMETFPRGALVERASGDGERLRLVAAREGLDGPAHDAVGALVAKAAAGLRVPS